MARPPPSAAHDDDGPRHAGLDRMPLSRGETGWPWELKGSKPPPSQATARDHATLQTYLWRQDAVVPGDVRRHANGPRLGGQKGVRFCGVDQGREVKGEAGDYGAEWRDGGRCYALSRVKISPEGPMISIFPSALILPVKAWPVALTFSRARTAAADATTSAEGAGIDGAGGCVSVTARKK